MTRILPVSVALAILLAAAPANAGVRMEPASCPFAADISLAVTGAASEEEGVDGEYAWIKANKPGWRASYLATKGKSGRVYDLIRISKGGEARMICFDITAFWGKF